MDVNSLKALLEPTGQRLLSAATSLAPTLATLLSCNDKLRKQFPPELVQAALDLVLLRQKAKAKFTHAEKLYFTRDLLEMATSERVAKHRAMRLRGLSVLDLCCGLGSDALAMNDAGCRVTSWDIDPLAVALCRANAQALNQDHAITVEQHDALTTPLPDVQAVFADPARRSAGKRSVSMADYSPSVQELLKRLPADCRFAVKLAPGIPLNELAAFDAECEFVSLNGELKEAVLWFGGFRSCRRRASLLTTDETHTLIAETELFLPELSAVQAFLYDPDPAVVRAGLVPKLAELLSATQTDGLVQLLTTASCMVTPFATVYRVDEVLPVDVKRINSSCLTRGIGRVTLMNRGSLAEMVDVQRKLKLSGAGHRHLIVTRQLGQQVAILAERVDDATSRHQ